MYFMCGPRQFFTQCSPSKPKVWTAMFRARKREPRTPKQLRRRGWATAWHTEWLSRLGSSYSNWESSCGWLSRACLKNSELNFKQNTQRIFYWLWILVLSIPPHCIAGPEKDAIFTKSPIVQYNPEKVLTRHIHLKLAKMSFVWLECLRSKLGVSFGSEPTVVFICRGQSSALVTLAILEEILIWTCSSSHSSPSCKFCSLSTSRRMPEVNKRRNT